MKAVLLQRTGSVENLKIHEIEKPKASQGKVLIETRAISVNPVDFKVRGNEEVLTMIYGEERPAILGWDVAGHVVEVGEDVTGFAVGDRVFGMVNFLGAGKAYVGYVAAPVAFKNAPEYSIPMMLSQEIGNIYNAQLVGLDYDYIR